MAKDWDDDSDMEEKTAMYHGSFHQLKRIDELWKKIHEYFVDVNYPKVNEFLDCVWLEFEDDADDELKDKVKELNKQIENLHVYTLNHRLKKVNKKLYFDLLIRQKKALMEKQILLRALQNSSGKGTKYQDSLADYADG